MGVGRSHLQAPSCAAGEADIVVHHVKSLLDAGVAASSIAVIAPYNLQVYTTDTDTHY